MCCLKPETLQQLTINNAGSKPEIELPKKCKSTKDWLSNVAYQYLYISNRTKCLVAPISRETMSIKDDEQHIFSRHAGGKYRSYEEVCG